jgi:hypothetical protein
MLCQPAAIPVSTALAHGHQPKPSSRITSASPTDDGDRCPMKRDEPTACSTPGRSGSTSWLPTAATTWSNPARRFWPALVSTWTATFSARSIARS